MANEIPDALNETLQRRLVVLTFEHGAKIQVGAREAAAEVRAGRITPNEARARIRPIGEAFAQEVLDRIYLTDPG